MQKQIWPHAQKFRAPDYSALLRFAKRDHCPSSRKTVTACGNFHRGKLSRSQTRTFEGEFISKIGDCLKEADETAYWLELLSEENIVFKTRIEPLLKEIDELIAILVTVSKHSRGD